MSLIGLIVAALIGALFLIESRVRRRAEALTLGLDLKGGLEVVLQAVKPKGQQLTSADLDPSCRSCGDRIDALGVSEPEIRKQEPNQIVIQLAGIHDPRDGGEDHRPDCAARALRPRGRHDGPSIDSQGSRRAPAPV